MERSRTKTEVEDQSDSSQSFFLEILEEVQLGLGSACGSSIRMLS